jgi:hypothetical protein
MNSTGIPEVPGHGVAAVPLLLRKGETMRGRNGMWMVLGLMLGLSPLGLGGPRAWAQTPPPQQEHHHASPHGGQVMTAGKYHLELVVQEHQTVQVYLYDNALQPVTVPSPEATLYLRLPGNKNHTLTLKAVGGSTATSWVATTDVLRDVPAFDAALRVALEGEPRNIRFTYKDEHGDKGGHTGGQHQ